MSITAHSGVLRCICWCVTVRGLRRGSRCANNSGWDGDTCMMACASWYAGYGAGNDVRVTLCGLRCAGTVCACVCVCVGYDRGNTMWLVMSR